MKANTKGKCICQICTCGRHRCPHNRGSLGDEPIKAECALKSEYQTVYEMWRDQERRRAIRPPMRPHTTSVPMDTQTMYKQVYTAHPVMAEIVKPKREYIPTVNNTDLKSTYMGDYQLKDGKRSDSFKPNYIYKQKNGRFPTDTNYRDTYKAFMPEQWQWCRSRPMRHKESIINSPTKMDATSVMKDDFIPHANHIRAELIRPQQQEAIVRGRFDPKTTYKIEYVVKSPVEATGGRRPCEYVPPTNPFEGETTFRSDYQPHVNASRAPCYKPNIAYHPNKVPFEGKTTSTDAYKGWPVQRIEKPAWSIRKASNENGELPFSKTSSYQDDYIKPESFERTKAANPGNQHPTLGLAPGQGNFPKTTQYRDEYHQYNVKPPKSFKINNVYETPAEPMGVESTYQGDYQGDNTAPAQICKPSMQTTLPRRPLTFGTTYVDTYKGERNEECPAKEVAKCKDTVGAYVPAGIKNGHHYYMVTASPKAVAEALVRAAAEKDAVANPTPEKKLQIASPPVMQTKELLLA